LIVARERTDYGLEEHRRTVPVEVRSSAEKRARLSLMVMVVIAFLLGAAFSYANTYAMNVSYQAESLKKDIAILEAENQSLKAAIDRLDSLPRVEILAVNQLGMIRPTPNDMLFVAIGDPGPAAVSGAVDPEPTKPAVASDPTPEERGLPEGETSDPGILQAFLDLVIR